jgi:uncharacterized protein YjiK
MKNAWIFLFLVACSSSPVLTENLVDYNYSSPTRRYELPAILKEVSGLVVKDSLTVVCVQDELGVLYDYSLSKKNIVAETDFSEPGDFEGIAKVGSDFWVLRSDGVLFRVSPIKNNNVIESFPTEIPADNNEGLCYDAKNNRLLIACKGKVGKGKELKDKRRIYAFDLTTKVLSEEPVYDFDIAEVVAYVKKEELNVPTREKKKEDVPVIRFRISAIGIHPITGELYVLSSADHMLLIYSASGQLLEVNLLDEEMYNKPEGISFFDNGDLLITNEGQDKQPTLFLLNYK